MQMQRVKMRLTKKSVVWTFEHWFETVAEEKEKVREFAAALSY
jgi:hypothetical protein